jgi:RNA polymerase sigma-70 factor (ECF subfamily)
MSVKATALPLESDLKQSLTRPGLMDDGMDQASERHLIARCRSGDEAAFGELVDQYKNLVFALISRTVSDQTRVEDLAQDVFLRVYRGLPDFRAQSRLSTWIHRIAWNVCADERGYSTGAWTVVGDPDRSYMARGCHDKQFSELELRDWLEKALARLPLEARFLIAGYYFGERTYEELAEALKMPIGTVKTHLHRAKRRLRELLEDEFR